MREVQFDRIPIVSGARNEIADYVLQAAGRGEAQSYRLINAGTLQALRGNGQYRELLRRSGVNLPDGKPLAALLRHTSEVREPFDQIRGPWLFAHLLDHGRTNGVRHYLLGTSDSTLDQLRTRIEATYPGTIIVGSYSPPFRKLTELEQSEQDTRIQTSGADLVWVALGTPRQDLESSRISEATGCTTLAVGAAFDFVAGTKRVAPTWISLIGMEWAFRLACEPRRLWRRYLFGNLLFLRKAVQHIWGYRSA